LSPQRSAPLSFAEPRLRAPLREWVDRSLADGLSQAKREGKAFLYVSTKRLEEELPLGVFDSCVADVQFFGSPCRAVLGVGVARSFELGPSKLMGSRARRSLQRLGPISGADASEVTVIGGWGFPSARRQRGASAWRDFPPSLWVVPAFTFTSSGGETRLALAASVRASSEAAPLLNLYRRLLDEMEPRPRRGDALPMLKRAQSIPSRKRWASLAQEAVDSISKGELEKVVLSRALALTFHHDLSAHAVLKRLVASNPDSTVFAVKRRGSVFLGASPESLLSVRRGEVEVDCLAASSPRTGVEATDDALGARLLDDPKSRREHRFVVEAAVGALSPMSSRVEVASAPVLKKLTAIQHLYTPVKATLREGEDVWDAAMALWPNPAIGGEPKERAVRWIRSSEELRRGWYSGVVGVLNARQDQADMVVGIRSGVIKGRRAVVYAGAGIVAGSLPGDELEETGWKLRTMKSALGVEAEDTG